MALLASEQTCPTYLRVWWPARPRRSPSWCWRWRATTSWRQWPTTTPTSTSTASTSWRWMASRDSTTRPSLIGCCCSIWSLGVVWTVAAVVVGVGVDEVGARSWSGRAVTPSYWRPSFALKDSMTFLQLKKEIFKYQINKLVYFCTRC